MLIKHADKKVAKLQVVIEKMEKYIEAVTLKEVINKNYEVLDKVMDEYQLYLHDKKLRKIKRDDMDYKEGRIYTFARKYDNVKITNLGKRTCGGYYRI
ncbi:hypothetical protein NDU88_005872 [Pleurodeles waltl]|uniref:Uncharacterized protein n=1 Tax=Pleurodeles waltl TaxID=8319 RepID=A0AAV7NNK8_PLEWA|nr:hypothetical protein NDU88_005872 [Pleurodeles waltl]